MDVVVAGHFGVWSLGAGEGYDFVEHLGAGEIDEAFVERFGHAGEMEVPLQDFAELEAAEAFAAAGYQSVKVACHEVDSLFISGHWAGLAGFAPGIELLEHEGIGEGASTDGDGGAAGFLEHSGGVIEGADITVGDDRHAVDGLDDGADSVAVDLAAEALRAGSAVNDHGRDADLLEGAGERGGREIVVIPAEPHLDCHGNLDRLDDGLDEIDGALHFAHQGGSAPGADDLADGTAHVDIDKGNAVGLDPLGGLAHLVGDGAVDLDREGTIGLTGLGQFKGAAAAVNE